MKDTLSSPYLPPKIALVCSTHTLPAHINYSALRKLLFFIIVTCYIAIYLLPSAERQV